jgi:hypothetical protein
MYMKMTRLLGLLLLMRAVYAGVIGPTPEHVVMVIEENRDYSQIVGSPSAPYINSLIAQGALMTNSFATTHPSQPNYLDLFSGSTQGVTDNSTPHTFSTANLASVLIDGAFTFGGYSETMPFIGYTGSTAGASNEYQRKHNPWVNFTNIPTADNMPYTSFPSDFSLLPTVSIVVPNQLNDMHDVSTTQGDAWLQTNLSAYIAWAMNHNSLFILTFDENNGVAGNHIVTLFVGPMVIPGQYGEVVNHYNLLRTIEDLYGVGYAGNSATAAPISDVFTPEPGTMWLVAFAIAWFCRYPFAAFFALAFSKRKL